MYETILLYVTLWNTIAKENWNLESFLQGKNNFDSILKFACDNYY